MSFLHTTGCALQTEQQVSHLGHAGEKLKPFSGEKTPEGRWDMAKGQLGGGLAEQQGNSKALSPTDLLGASCWTQEALPSITAHLACRRQVLL